MNRFEKNTSNIVNRIGERLIEKKELLVTAESCTGGWVGQIITSSPGTSRWYDRGFITYSNTSKREVLNVSTNVITRFGAVSEQTARAMAEGALKSSCAQYSLSITGIAGPAGGTDEKPVGTVCFAWASKKKNTESQSCRFDGDRQKIRMQAVQYVLEGLAEYISAD